MKKVYCIIVAYNGMTWIERCLTSVISGTVPVTIVCIDNCSADGTADFIRQHFPEVLLIQAESNLGFGQANNIGLRLAITNEADYVFLLNQDAAVEPGTIETLVKVHALHQGFGVISPVHLNGSGSAPDKYFLQYLSRSQMPAGAGAADLVSQQKDMLVTTTFVNAAAWLLSMDCIKNTGGFNPVFFHYGEDDNYLQRVHYKGFKTGIYLGCRIYHDRETQLNSGTLSAEQLLKKEWIFFLTNACDVNSKGYQWMMIKRFFRHALTAVKSFFIFNKAQALFQFNMARNIFVFRRAIIKSHAEALEKNAPYL